jgi:predicted nucleotidyltransferase
MKLTNRQKEIIKKDLIDKLKKEKEVRKIIIFGTFLKSNNPNDIDIAIFQDSSESYLNLAMKYRRITRSIANKIPLDIIPIKSGIKDNIFLSELINGELVYER